MRQKEMKKQNLSFEYVLVLLLMAKEINGMNRDYTN